QAHPLSLHDALPISGAEPGPLAVGSLLKPFVAKAWAHAHPGVPPPVERCERASGCWRPAGHGTAGLTRALAVSCNAYFKKMAAEDRKSTRLNSSHVS